jgi:hypothetical protein
VTDVARPRVGEPTAELPSIRSGRPIRIAIGTDAVSPAATGWGRVPLLALVASAGLLMIAAAYVLAADGSSGTEPLFWIGFLVIGGPITIRLAAAAPLARERVALLLVLGMALYLASVARSPEAFTGYDELLHFRSLNDVLASGRLFEQNPLLSVSPHFPGLEILTAAVIQVSGADPFTTAVVLLGAVRILFVLALYGLYVEASGSERVAGLAGAIYMLNPNFAFFDSQFAYESLALPLVPALLLAVAFRARRTDSTRWLSLAVIVCGLTIVVTHHITTYVTIAILGAWLFVHLVRWRWDRYRGAPIAGTLLLVGIAGGVWLVLVASITMQYLGAPLAGAVEELSRLLEAGAARTPFQSATGAIAPLPERLLGLGTAALLCATIPIGLIPLVRHLRDSSLALLLGLMALGYPLSLIGRLMPTGSEAAGRSLAVISLGLSFVAALAALQLLELPSSLRAGPTPLRRAAAALERRTIRGIWWSGFAAAVAVLVLGGVVIGTAPSTRFPGPYLVGADVRSIDASSTKAAVWTTETLGPHQRIAADRVNRLLQGAYGQADVVFHGSDGVETWRIFLSPGVGAAEAALLREGRIRYVLIDRRLSTSLPLIPFYYEEGEIFEGSHLVPVPPDILAKWDGAAGVDRIYDSGAIQIYRVDGVYRDD